MRSGAIKKLSVELLFELSEEEKTKMGKWQFSSLLSHQIKGFEITEFQFNSEEISSMTTPFSFSIQTVAFSFS